MWYVKSTNAFLSTFQNRFCSKIPHRISFCLRTPKSRNSPTGPKRMWQLNLAAQYFSIVPWSIRVTEPWVIQALVFFWHLLIIRLLYHAVHNQEWIQNLGYFVANLLPNSFTHSNLSIKVYKNHSMIILLPYSAINCFY